MTHIVEPGMSWVPGDEVFTEDGRKAEFAGQINGQYFVRIVMERDDDQYGYESWVSDKLTPVPRIFRTPPLEAYDKAITQAKKQLADIKDEIDSARASLAKANTVRDVFEAAAKRYPDIQTALDFLDGKITHVAILSHKWTISTLDDCLVSADYHQGDGLRLLALFGNDPQGKPKWSVNKYRDGSGSWTEIIPFRSELELKAFLKCRFETAIALWRAGDEAHGLGQFVSVIPEQEWPRDWRDHCVKIQITQAENKIEKFKVAMSQVEAELSDLTEQLNQGDQTIS